MPKQNHQITRFDKGLILDIAKEDLAEGLAVKNTRNCLFTSFGDLRGYPAEVSANVTVSSAPKYAGVHQFSDGQKVFFIDGTNLKYFTQRAPNVKGSPTVTTISISTWNVDANKITVQQRLDSLFMGTGSAANNTSKWIGYNKHTQFGSAGSDSVIAVDDSECYSPSNLTNDNLAFPNGIGVVHTAGKSFMISSGSAKIFKFNGVTLENESLPYFFAPKIIANDSVSGYFWIYDSFNSNLYRVKDDFTIEARLTIGGLPEDGMEIHDICVIDNRIYFSRSEPVTMKGGMENRLWSISRISAGNTAVSATNHSFSMIENGTIAPAYEYPGPISSWALFYDYQLPVRCLFENNGKCSVIAYLDGQGQVRSRPDTGLREGVEFTEYTPSRGRGWIYTDGTTTSNTVSAVSGATNVIVFHIDATINDSSVLTKANFALLNEVLNDSTKVYNGYDLQVAGSSVELLSLDGDDVKRIRFTKPSTTTPRVLGSMMITTLSAFASNEITKPVAGYISGSNYFFSSGSGVPKVGNLSSSGSLSNITTSQQSMVLTPYPGGFSEKDKGYFYKLSLLYDGFQESPLSNPVSTVADENGLGYSLTINLPTANLSRRASHLNIYRSKGDAVTPEEFYRLVDTISLAQDFATATVGGSTVRIITYLDLKDDFELGSSFETNAGIPENMIDTNINYGLSAVVDDFMFVADCSHPRIPDAKYMLFRSNPLQFSVFNWEINVLRLPTVPIAMVEFSNRIFVFDQKQCFVINPIQLTIDNHIVGLGAINKESVKITPYGLVVAGLDAMRLYTGGQPEIMTQDITLPEPTYHKGLQDSSYLDAKFSAIDSNTLSGTLSGSITTFGGGSAAAYDVEVYNPESTFISTRDVDGSGNWSYGTSRQADGMYRFVLVNATPAHLPTPNPNLYIDGDNFMGDYKSLAQYGTKHHVVFSYDDTMLHFIAQAYSGTMIYSYDMISQSWSRLFKPSFAVERLVEQNNNALLAFTGNGSFYLFNKVQPDGGTITRRNIPYFVNLKPFDGQDANIDKWYYELRMDIRGDNPTVYGKINNGSFVSLGSAAGSGGKITYTIPSELRQGKTLEIAIESQAEIKSISLIYRPKIVRS